MFKIFVDYPSFDEEFEVARQTTTATTNEVETVLTAEEIVSLQQVVREVPVSDHVIRYALSLVRQTRIGHPGIRIRLRQYRLGRWSLVPFNSSS